VVWTYAGVRPISYDDGASEGQGRDPRDYVSSSIPPAARRCCRFTAARSRPIAVSPREALERLSPYLRSAKAREGWTAKSPLPGGDLDVSAISALAAELIREYPFLSTAHANRLAHAYGTRAGKVLGHAKISRRNSVNPSAPP